MIVTVFSFYFFSQSLFKSAQEGRTFSRRHGVPEINLFSLCGSGCYAINRVGIVEEYDKARLMSISRNIFYELKCRGED